MSRARSERGSATLLLCVVLAAVVGVTVLVALAGVVRALGEGVRGAADLAALAGARAQAANADACAAARASAARNAAELTACRVVGDEIEYVVVVEVRRAVRVGPAGQWLAARANAGMVTGAPG